MEESDLAVRDLTECSPEAVEHVQRIYETSFPPSEREPFAKIRANVASGDYGALVADLGGVPVGLCVASWLSLGALYIEYFAIEPALRSQGIGGRFLRACLPRLLRPGDAGAVLEVERLAAAPHDDARARRIAFWQRQGAVAIQERFPVPRLDGQPGVEEMTLMWIPRDGRTGPVDAAGLARALYTEAYTLDDQEITALQEA